MPAAFGAFPSTACWRHKDAQEGFEVVYFARAGEGWVVDGATAAIEAGETWYVEYSIRLGGDGLTEGATVTGRSSQGTHRTELEADGSGHWLVDGKPAPLLDGCLDLDLESSAMTNAFPIRRLALPVGATANVPAAYLRALDLAVERLQEQIYERLPGGDHRFAYASPSEDFSCELVYDESGLVLDYPGIAQRVA